MSGEGPRYSAFNINLNSAGEQTLDMFTGVLRVTRIEDATGALDLSGLVQVRVGHQEGDWIILGVGNAVTVRTARRLTVKWTAQTGLTARIFTSPDPAAFDVDADPPAQLAVGDLASSFTAANVTIGTSAGLVAAANGTRKSLTVYNNGSAVIYLGGSGVTTAAGLPLAVGQGITFDGNTAAVYGISGSAGQDVRYFEEG